MRYGIVQGLEEFAGGLSKAWIIAALIVPMLGTFCQPSQAATVRGQADIAGLDAMVARLADLRLQIADEQREWGERKPRLQREIDLLKDERTSLQTELDGYRDERSSLSDERAELLRTQRRYNDGLAQLKESLRTAEQALAAIKPRIPAPLLGNLQSAYEQLPNTEEAADAISVSRRLQVVLSLYSGIQKLQHDFNTARPLIAIDGERREMDTLYIGLTQAFAVAPDGSKAAVGSLGDGGDWQWRSADNLADRIGQAVAVYRREQPAELIGLPLRVEKGGAQ